MLEQFANEMKNLVGVKKKSQSFIKTQQTKKNLADANIKPLSIKAYIKV